MTPERYAAFGRALVANLRDDPRVHGVVAVGSMAAVTRQPDEWSDHDVWIIAAADQAPALRDDRTWLPDHDEIVLHWTETEHGRSAIYADGHLVEYAVFELDELEIVRMNEYRMLVGDDDLAARLRRIAARPSEAPGMHDRLGVFLSQLVIGINRRARGELLSANELIRGRAPRTLLSLLAGDGDRGGLDDLDPHRRFEMVHPDLATAVLAAVELPLDAAAPALLDIARRELGGAVNGAVDGAPFAAVEALVERAGAVP